MPDPLNPPSDQQTQHDLQSIDTHMQAILSKIGKLVTLVQIVLALFLLEALVSFGMMGLSIAWQSRPVSNEKHNDAKLEQLQALRDQQQSTAPDHGKEHSEEAGEEHGDEDNGDEDH